ncbi:type II toxin-antitoxin system VapC family toxin [Uliginosibacterium sediminicola]|uniref:Ribonuclease VapC n=1 Tax=Uliginosibacterium sediminicola TaxID=2024550 RepID=A0ABU9YZV2_9RHOO
MKYLLDTNVLSEITRAQPEARVLEWMAAQPLAEQYLSSLTLGEIRYGVEKMAPGQRQTALRRWLEDTVPAQFSGRLLGIDEAVAHCWGRLRVDAGRPLPAIDGLLAATAIAHGLVLVTRNSADFAGLPSLQLCNPWLE